MKIAFDENVPAAMVRVFQLFQKERALKELISGVVIERAQDYYPRLNDPDHAPKNDAPWIKRFAASGGRIIISGNTKMQMVPHERLALVQEGMVVIFFANQWSNWKFCRKCALLLHWWPVILKAAKKAKPGFYYVPVAWPEEGKGKLREVSSEDLKLVKMDRQLAARGKVRKERQQKRESTAQGQLFDERQEPLPKG